MTTSEFSLQVFLEAVHGIQPQSMTLEQLERCLSAMRFAAPRWQEELRRRELAELRRRERELGEPA